MDPFSIVTIASNAARIAQTAWKLYEFIDNARKVDKTIRSLQNEIKQVGEVFGLVKEQVKLLPEGSDLLRAIQGQIDACTVPMATIESKLKCGKQSNIFRQAFRQIRLNLNEDELDLCQKQIQTSITNLHLSLQLVNLQATYTAAQRADDVLFSSIQNIQRTLDAQGQDIAEPLRQCASVYLSNGSSVYESRAGEGTIIGSEDYLHQNTVSNWLNQIDDSKTSGTRLASISQDITFPISRSASPSSFATARVYGSNDSLSTQVINASVALGKEAFYTDDFDKAESLFRESLDLIQALPKYEQHRYNLENLRLSHAICAFYTQDSTPAEVALATLVRAKLEDAENAEIKAEACECLAIIYVRMRNLDLAASTCESLYQDQTRLFGRDERCFKIIALLIWIYDMQGKSARADTYRSLIPANARDQYSKYTQELSSTEGLHLNMPKLPTFQAQHPGGSHHRVESIAWSQDNRYMSISKNFSPKNISLQCAMTGRTLYEWTLRFCECRGCEYTVFCHVFDRMSQKLAIAFSEENKSSKEISVFVHIFDVESRQRISGSVFMHSQFGRILSLTFNRTGTRVLVAFNNHHEEKGFGYAVIEAITGRQLHLGLTKNRGENVIWTGNYIALIDSYHIEFLNMGTYQPILGGKDLTALNFTVVAVCTTPSGALMIMDTEGNIFTYADQKLQLYSTPGCPHEATRVVSAAMTYNRQKILITVVANNSGQLYLGIPRTDKWTMLRKISLAHTDPPWFRRTGLSPDGDYAFWVERGEHGNDDIYKWSVRKHLSFDDDVQYANKW